MRKIDNIFKVAKANGTQPISFEIFPPKGELTLDAARKVTSELTNLYPNFVSVTYSAGGSGNSNATADIAALLQDELDCPAVAHLTCVTATKKKIEEAVDDLKNKGIQNVLALRGDIPKGVEPINEFTYAKDLIPLLKEAGFCVGAAAYPENHVDCFDSKLNIQHLKQKQEAGADFFVTQLFFDNESFFRFWDDALNAGITRPITAGIMPFLSKEQITRMVFMCGASLPAPIVKILHKYEHDPVSLRKAGIEYAAQQFIELSSQGVDGLHLYTMNQPDIAQTVVGELRKDWHSR